MTEVWHQECIDVEFLWPILTEEKKGICAFALMFVYKTRSKLAFKNDILSVFFFISRLSSFLCFWSMVDQIRNLYRLHMAPGL